jgi:hypothetical protein
MSTQPAAQQAPWVAPNLSGGIGNRLFQFAAAAGAAERWGRPVVFVLSRCGRSEHGPFENIFKLFPSVPVLESASNWLIMKEPPRMYYTHIPVVDTAPSDDNILVVGYYQSPKYFPHIGLTIDWDRVVPTKEIATAAGLTTEEEQRNTVALHVRLGDYKELPHHQQDLAKYYNQAVSRVPVGSRIHLFSDEPQLCLQWVASGIQGRGLKLTVAAVRMDIESLYEMSLCIGGTITANSTFSWWGAWFAHQRGAPWATYPSHWGAGQPEPTDLVPEWGTVVPVA